MQVREKIAAAADRSGRDADAVTLVAVSKTRSVDEALAAVAAGACDLGENYVQELVAKAGAVAAMGGSDAHWHFIGHLQRNKVRQIVPLCTLIHSVDSPRLVAEVNARATAAGITQPVLLQVSLAAEETKDGCPESELEALIEAVMALPGINWRGLMTITPLSPDPEAARPYYRRLAEIRDALLARGIPGSHLEHLSMGMSNDYEVAIEEGATMVRVGTAIFGPRH